MALCGAGSPFFFPLPYFFLSLAFRIGHAGKVCPGARPAGGKLNNGVRKGNVIRAGEFWRLSVCYDEAMNGMLSYRRVCFL